MLYFGVFCMTWAHLTKSRAYSPVVLLLPHLVCRDTALSKAKVKEAHRRMMIANHPDRGGAPYLASKINEAKVSRVAKRHACELGRIADVILSPLSNRTCSTSS